MTDSVLSSLLSPRLRIAFANAEILSCGFSAIRESILLCTRYALTGRFLGSFSGRFLVASGRNGQFLVPSPKPLQLYVSRLMLSYLKNQAYFCGVSSSRPSLQCLNRLSFFDYMRNIFSSWIYPNRKVSSCHPFTTFITSPMITLFPMVQHTICTIKYVLYILSPGNDIVAKMKLQFK